MNYVITNVRLSEEDYLRLKTEAAKARKSLSAIIREKLSEDKRSYSQSTVRKILSDLDTLAQKNSKKLKKFDSLKALQEMRNQNKW